VPIDTRATRAKESQNSSIGNTSDSERLNHLHPSILANPDIRKAKITEKNLRDKDRRDSSLVEKSGKENNETITNNTNFLNKNNNRSHIQENQSYKHIKLVNNQETYSIQNVLNNIPANITLAQLLDASPKLRSELNKLLKLEKVDTISAISNFNPSITLVNNIDHDYNPKPPKVNNEDLAMVRAEVDNVSARLLIDTCSNLNVVTKEFLSKINNYTEVGLEKGKIRQAATDCNNGDGIVVKFPLSIGDYTLTLKYRVLDNPDSFYDILIGLKAQADNKLVVIPHKNILSQMKDNNSYDTLAILNQGIEDEKLVCFINKNNSTFTEDLEKSDATLCCMKNEDSHSSNHSSNEQVNPLDGLSAYEYIHHNYFIQSLDEHYRSQLLQILEDNIDIIATSSNDLSPSNLSPHEIHLKPGTQPIKQRGYRLSKIKADVLKDELTKLIDKKLIVPSHSAWSSPVVLVPKHNGKWRMCVDYRKLNQVTEKDAYSLPLIDEIFDGLNGATVFSTLDLYSGYHQIPMHPESIDFTSFTTIFGNFNFNVMPFGLTNAPATFQREMNKILFPLIGKCVYNFIDDILVFSKTKEEHLTHLNEVLSIFRKNNLKINIEKCSFMKKEVKVLGHLLTNKGLRPLPDKIEAIVNWNPPKDVSELRSFLGTVGYYRQFIRNYSALSEPLCRLLKKNQKFIWTNEQDTSFSILKESLIKAPILKFPDFSRPFIIRTDASCQGLGGVLLQKGEEENGVEHPVHYISRTLKKAERNYGITDLEGAAVYYAITKFKPYILGNKMDTIIITDHKPLLGLFQNKEPNNARQTRWCIKASMLGVKIVYEPSKNNVVADSLSRLQSKIQNEGVISAIDSGENIKSKEINTKDEDKLKESNMENQENLNEVDTSILKELIDEKIVQIDGDKYFKDGNYYRKIISDENEKFQLILKAHAVGHEGWEKTYERLKRYYYWRNMTVDVKRAIGKCENCKRNRSQKYPTPTESYPTRVEGPFTHVGLDIVGPLPVTQKGNEYIIVLVDYFTKWVEAEAVKSVTSQDVVEFLVKVFSRHGAPEVVTTDNGPQFTSDYTKIFLDLYDVYVKFVSTYHPESNGLTENRNKEIGKYLRLLSSKNKEWDQVLPVALWALRTTKNSVTKHSSFELLYGRLDHQPFELLINNQRKDKLNKSDDEVYLEKFVDHYNWIQEACQNVKNANQYWATRREERNSMNQATNLEIGDKVYVRNFSRTKIEPYFVGPFQIVKIHFNTATLADLNTGELLRRNVHFKNLIKG